MYLDSKKINKLNKFYRANLINSIVGIKQASLIGTVSKNKIANVAIFSSIVHLGSNPALIGLFTRPVTIPPKQTLNNILEMKDFTINHLNNTINIRGHSTSYKFERNESEFKECLLTEKYIENFNAPFVKESNISFGLSYIRHEKIKENGVVFIIGSLKHILVNNNNITNNGEIDLSGLDSIGVSGNNTYYKLSKSQSLEYIKKEKREYLNKIVKKEKDKYNKS
ncbi:MAG: flavin oxidoreductase [Candidatus Marinimicrobia bacterium]|nr:flavin oxidoreductase [Candidatus Neomarinimicrobiota bacterium]OUW49854.1 MAG: hypothetical protein CBD50_04785 [bacterium TMED190]